MDRSLNKIKFLTVGKYTDFWMLMQVIHRFCLHYLFDVLTTGRVIWPLDKKRPRGSVQTSMTYSEDELKWHQGEQVSGVKSYWILFRISLCLLLTHLFHTEFEERWIIWHGFYWKVFWEIIWKKLVNLQSRSKRKLNLSTLRHCTHFRWSTGDVMLPDLCKAFTE